jgi:hypothetical protein
MPLQGYVVTAPDFELVHATLVAAERPAVLKVVD